MRDQPSLENLKRIAASNLDDLERIVVRSWCNRYRRPPTDPLLRRYTLEELVIEHFEEYYDKNPDKVQDVAAKDDWDGSVSDEHEREVQAKLKKLGHIDSSVIDRYKSDEKISSSDEKSILEEIGIVGEEEIEETYLGESDA